MKSLETLEKVINDAFKDDTDPKRVEALGTIKAELEHVKKVESVANPSAKVAMCY